MTSTVLYEQPEKEKKEYKGLRASGNKKGRRWTTARKVRDANPGRLYPSPNLIKSSPILTHSPPPACRLLGTPGQVERAPFRCRTTSDVTDTRVYFISALTNEQPSTGFSVPSSAEGTNVEEHRRISGGYGWMGKALAHMCEGNVPSLFFLSDCRCASIHSV